MSHFLHKKFLNMGIIIYKNIPEVRFPQLPKMFIVWTSENCENGCEKWDYISRTP